MLCLHCFFFFFACFLFLKFFLQYFNLFQFSFFFPMFVKACPILIAREHECSSCSSCISLSSCSSQRVGALSLIPSCLGISGHPSGSRSGHPRYTGARSAGRAVGGPNTVQHSRSQCEKHSKYKMNTECFGQTLANPSQSFGMTSRFRSMKSREGRQV